MTTISFEKTQSIAPHGGVLINREVKGKEREELLAKAEKMPSLTISAWSISDLELIGIGGFSLFIAKLKCRDVQNFYANGYAERLYMEGQP